MIKKKIIGIRKQEYQLKEYIMNKLGKRKITDLKIERTPIGEKIILVTAHPGWVIGRDGSSIQEIFNDLRNIFKFENPQVEIAELKNPEHNARSIADQMAMSLEKFGPLGFKIAAYRELERLTKSGCLGAEIRLSGRLPSERAKSWRFGFGYLIKTGEYVKICDKAQATAFTKSGVVGVKISLIPKGTKIPDKIEINKEVIDQQLKRLEEEINNEKIEKGKKKVNK